MADGEAAGIELGEQRLHVAQDGRAGRGIADVAYGDGAGEAFDHLAAGKRVADQAEAALRVEPCAVEGDDAGGLLAAVLQSVQAERGDGGGLGMAEDAEHAAFFAERVAVQVGVSEFYRTQIAFVQVQLVLCGVFGRARFKVHRASLLAWLHFAAGFSISFLRLSRAGLV